MGGVVDFLTDAVEGIIGAIVDAVITIWQELVVPILGEIFAVFGIEDENVVTVSKVSIAVLSDDPNNIVRKAFTKTVMGMADNGAGFYKNYVQNFNRHKGEMNSYYNYAAKGPYVYGLPTMVVKGTNLDYDAIDTAINSALGGTFTVLSGNTTYPEPDLWFKYQLQSAPYNYLPSVNTLTKTASNGVSYSDWAISNITFNNTAMEYDIVVSRTAEISYIGIVANDVFVVEGNTTTLTVSVNRPVPTGQSLVVDLSYSGALASEYNAPSSVTISAGASSATVTIDTVVPAAAKRLDIEISVADRSAYEGLNILESQRFASVVLCQSGVPTLCVGRIVAQEGSSVTFPVTLSEAASGAFTVNWQTADTGSAIAGSDYTAASGTLSFAGTANETKNITVTTLSDALPESYETLAISLTGVSGGGAVAGGTGIVVITDSAVAMPTSSTGLLTEIISLPNYNLERHLVVTYHEASAPATDWFYWLYRLADQTYANIDPTSSSISNLDMLPVGILRKNKQFINEDKDVANDLLEDFGVSTDVYKTTRNLLKRINLKIEDVITTVGENPDIDVVDDVYVNFSMCPLDTNQVLSKLFWLHWYEIIVVRGVQSNNEAYSATFEEQDVNNALAWSAHSHETNVTIPGNLFLLFLRPKFDEAKVGEYFHHVNTQNLFVCKKVSTTQADVIKIENLAGMNAIAYDGFHNVAFNNVEEEGFTMPISWYLIRKLRGNEVLEVFPYIFRLDLFSIQITELAWYQTGAFKTFFNIVMVIITIYTLGTASSFLKALGQLLFQYLVVQIVIYIAELTGNVELAAVVGIVATLYLGSKMGMSFDLTTADGLTTAVTMFSSNLGAAQQGELKALGEDLSDLVEEFERQKEYQRENAVSAGAIGGAEYWSLKGVDTMIYESRELQFNFDLLFDYDNLIGNWFEQQLAVGPQ